MNTFFLIAVVALFTSLLVFAEYKHSARGRWLTKPVASLGFVALAYSRGALNSNYGRVVFGGLVLAALGDVLLIPKSTAIFRLGILAFLLGHVAFIAAFILRGIALPPFEALLIPTAIAGFLAGRWLLPHGGELKGAIAVYILVISIMVPAAFATTTQHGNILIAGGALAFYFSDLSVARDRFIHATFVNRLWGLPLYYAAQVLLALSVRSR